MDSTQANPKSTAPVSARPTLERPPCYSAVFSTPASIVRQTFPVAVGPTRSLAEILR